MKDVREIDYTVVDKPNRYLRINASRFRDGYNTYYFSDDWGINSGTNGYRANGTYQ